MLSDYFFANIEYNINKLGFQYPEKLNDYNEDFIIVSIAKSTVNALEVTLDEIWEQEANFKIIIEPDHLNLLVNPVVRFPWYYIAIRWRLAILLDIRMLTGMKSTWPLPSLLPLINELEIYDLYISIFGIGFNISRTIPYITEYVRSYANEYIVHHTFRGEKSDVMYQ